MKIITTITILYCSLGFMSSSISATKSAIKAQATDNSKYYISVYTKAAQCGSCGYFYNYYIENVHTSKAIWATYSHVCYFGGTLETKKIKLEPGEKKYLGTDAKSNDCSTKESTYYVKGSCEYAN